MQMLKKGGSRWKLTCADGDTKFETTQTSYSDYLRKCGEDIT